jgi:hypothetical protein
MKIALVAHEFDGFLDGQQPELSHGLHSLSNIGSHPARNLSTRNLGAPLLT